MFQSLLSRRLPPSAALPARPSHIASWTNLSPRNNNHNRRAPHCLFSSTPSSPFSRAASLKAASPSGDDDPLPYYSPHQPKRQWPPDISKLSSKHQFRLERKYRRRAALKWERPQWKKWTKIMQYGLYACRVVPGGKGG
ncbi:hypothetical protein PHISP_01009 [Aspergillus sp. HF37]|nr:hypothetical protein PHISP_01009 [Aspergillus sp. HF37]